jgi:3-phosphoshikimate 1-carboxyvinyltransferase
MSLGDLIEIMPLKEPVSARITVPGSKSITNRALVLAALADGPVVLRGALWSEDTEVMVNCLRVLGFEIKVDKDPEETGNRIIRVIGRCGIVPNSGTSDEPLELFVGNAGTAARFLSALVCLGEGTFRLSGIDRMHERPQAALFEALRQLGYRIDAENDRLPAVIHGSGPRAGSCKVRIDQSSQFASALLLLARRGGWTVEIDAYDPDQAPYVTMTEELISGFPLTGGALIIEPDTSSASYFIGANGLLTGFDTASEPLVWVKDWPDSTWQIDTAFPEFMGIDRKSQRAEFSRATDLGDSIMTAIALAPFFPIRSQFNDLGRLRVQECERVEALCTELTRCGASVEEEGDTARRSRRIMIIEWRCVLQFSA